MTADLPLSSCAPTADVEQEKKNTDDCERLHVYHCKKRLSPTGADSGYCKPCPFLPGASAHQKIKKLKKENENKTSCDTKQAGCYVLLPKSLPEGGKI